MKKKIVILGSTGSIGKTLINIIQKDKKSFEIVLLTADKNKNELIKQAKSLKVKNLIITDKKSFNDLKNNKSNKRFKIYNDYKNLNKIFVSTTFAKNDSKISEVLLTCKKANISNIELGSNHCYEKNYKKIIKKHKLNFIVHNYFPIPKKSFVVNIASANRVIRNLSIKHVKNAILFCKTTNSKLYTFHPGFIFDPVTASNSKKNYDKDRPIPIFYEEDI